MRASTCWSKTRPETERTPTLPKTDPETFLDILEDFLSRQINWSRKSEKLFGHSSDYIPVTFQYICSPLHFPPFYFFPHTVLKSFFITPLIFIFYNLLFPLFF